ncbi:MAG TPA: response regulator transcription factor, partial [Propionibacteriaceae bacterium]|nr:response regulator transcription factor [Propionibacteriaceae bacterium]
GQVSKVLVVEASEQIRTAVVSALRSRGHQAQGLPDATLLERALAAAHPDLVILEAHPASGPDGFALLATIRRLSRASVIMLTARDEASDRLHVPAPDEMVRKPFAMVELLARCEATLRRGPSASGVTVSDLTVADDGATVTMNGTIVDLTDTERRLLAHLARHAGRVVSKAQLLAAVWGYDGYDENIVEVHISSLRRRLEAHGPRLIHTVRGRGYRLGEP